MKGTPWPRLALGALLLVPLVLTACDGEASLPSTSRSRSPGDGISVPTAIPSLLPTATPSRSPKPTQTETDPPAPSRSTPPVTETTETTTETQTQTETATETTTPATTATETSTTTQTETEAAASTPAQDVASPVGGEAEEGSAATAWLVAGLVAIVAIGGGLLLMRRRSGRVSVQDAYLAGAAIRDRVSAEVATSAPLPVVQLMSELDAADLTIRNARAASTGDDLVRLDRLVLAVAAVRSGIEASSSAAEGAHAADSEGDLLRALAQLNAVLGDLAPGAPRS